MAVTKKISIKKKFALDQCLTNVVWADRTVGQKIAKDVMAKGLPAVKTLVSYLHVENSDEAVRAGFALEALRTAVMERKDNAEMEMLCTWLQEAWTDCRDASARAEVCRQLAMLGGEITATEIIDKLAQPNEDFQPVLMMFRQIGGWGIEQEILKLAAASCNKRHLVALASALADFPIDDEDPRLNIVLAKALAVAEPQELPALWLTCVKCAYQPVVQLLLEGMDAPSKTLAGAARAALYTLLIESEGFEDTQEVARRFFCEYRCPAALQGLICCLGEVNEIYEILLDCAVDDDSILRHNALRFLSGMFAGPLTTEMLVAHASTIQESAVLADFIRMLGERDDATAQNYVMSMLFSRQAEVRAAALEAAGRLSPGRAINLIAPALLV